MEDIREVVWEVITRISGVLGSKITDHSFLWSDLGIDQIERWELKELLMKKFGVEISDEEIEEWEIVIDIIDCIQNKIEE